MEAMGPTVLPQHTGAPLFFGGSLHYARWFRQSRRLQAYTQIVRKNSCNKVSVWSAIVNASGFAPSFVEWWEARHVHCVGAVDQVPTQAPSLEIAQGIFLAFKAEVRHLEYVLSQQRFQQAKQRRKQTARLVFRDIARDQPLPAQNHCRAGHPKWIKLVGNFTSITTPAQRTAHTSHHDRSRHGLFMYTTNRRHHRTE